MATVTHMKPGIDSEFVHPSDQDRKYEKILDFESLSDLSPSELDEFIDDFVKHFPTDLLNS
jgi:hypothetical protein